MLSYDDFTQSKNNLKNYQINKCDYEILLSYFQESNFFFFDIDHCNYDVDEENSIDNFKKQFSNNQNLTPIVFFYFIQDGQDIDTQNRKNNDNDKHNYTDLYLVLYSNKIGMVYDLILGPDLLQELFDTCFNNFCLVPQHTYDNNKLAYLIDLSNNYFLNSTHVSSCYQKESLKDIVYKIWNPLKNKFSRDKEKYFILMITLIVYYVPLVSIVNDDFILSPSHYKSEYLPEFNTYDFEEIAPISSNSFQTYSLTMYKKNFEFYIVITMRSNDFSNNFEIEKEFYKKMYKKSEYSFTIPCYGTFEHQANLRSSIKGFLCKFINNGKITDFLENKRSNGRVINYFDNTTKSLIIYRLLSAITCIHESGFYIRNVKPDHIFLDNQNRSYFGGIATLSNLENERNEQIGSSTYQSPEQYHDDKSSPLSDVYSFAANVFFIITGIDFRRDYNKYINEYKELKIIFDECIESTERPDSLILLIQMYYKKILIPKTNQKLINDLFQQIFYFYFKIGITGGKYLSKWSNDVHQNEYRNLIESNLSISFVAEYAYSNMEINLNRFLNLDLTHMIYDKMDIFRINFFAEILKNKYLKNETDDLINQIPVANQILNRIIMYHTYIDFNSKINDLFKEEVKNFAKNFDDCILLANSFNINPSFILEILTNENPQLKDSHNTIQFLLQTDIEDIKIVHEILSFFSSISYHDACKLDAAFETDVFSNEYQSKLKFKTIDLYTRENEIMINNIREKLNKSCKSLDKISKETEGATNIDLYFMKKDHNEIIEILNKINEDQEHIDLYKKTLNTANDNSE